MPSLYPSVGQRIHHEHSGKALLYKCEIRRKRRILRMYPRWRIGFAYMQVPLVAPASYDFTS